jgi:aryl-alcohol dehydrogenase-like predicted oxidoreductase
MLSVRHCVIALATLFSLNVHESFNIARQPSWTGNGGTKGAVDHYNQRVQRYGYSYCRSSASIRRRAAVDDFSEVDNVSDFPNFSLENFIPIFDEPDDGNVTDAEAQALSSVLLKPYESYPLGKDAYTLLGDLPICRIINGLWQTSGKHDYTANRDLAVADMTKYADSGFTSFAVADTYGASEEFAGSMQVGPLATTLSEACQFLTQWTPETTTVTRAKAAAAVRASLLRTRKEQIDLMQLRWNTYENKHYYDAINYLMDLQQRGQVRHIGLCNFDTEHLLDLIDEDAPIVSNEVSFSIVDTRATQFMIPACIENDVKLLCHGTLLGGFLTEQWLGKRPPDMRRIPNASLQVYYKYIQRWGGWDLFQELLHTLDGIAKKHSVSIANVAVRWVLDQPAVGAVVLGARLGMKVRND